MTALSFRSALLFAAAALALSANCAEARPSAAAPQGTSKRWNEQQHEQAWATANLLRSPRRSEWVSIRFGDRTLRAFITYPATRRRGPVVIVGHEVFGLTDSTRNTADRIAAMGYVTIAPDMLSGLAPNGGGTPDMPAALQAGTMMTYFPSEYANAQFDAWAAYAAKMPQSNGKLAIVGLSWSGGAAFRYAAMGHHPSLKVVNVFYDTGPPAANQGFSKYDPKVLAPAVTGIDVPIYQFIPSRDIRVVNSAAATKAAMDVAGKTYQQIVLDGAEHAFFRIGEDPKDTNAANDAAIAASYARLEQILGGL